MVVAVKEPGRVSRFLGKFMVGLFVLVALVGVANRLLSGDSPSPSALPTTVADAGVAPGRTPARADVAASNTPAPTRRPPARISEQVSTLPTTPTPAEARPATQPDPSPSVIGAGLPTDEERLPIGQTDALGSSEPSLPPSPTFVPSRTPVPPSAAAVASTPATAPTVAILFPIRTSTPLTQSSAQPTAVRPELALAATDCAGYDAWEWAQSVYETDPNAYAALDPDGNGIACDGLGHGFAPAFWTDSLPERAVAGTMSYIVDGDTYEIIVNGVSARYRLYRADTPEVGNQPQCGGASATDFVRYALSFDDVPDRVWIDGVDQRDKYGRKLAYLWFVSGGEPYLLNHMLINNGWAEDIDYGDAFDPYDAQLRAAAKFAREHQLGVWAECGGFGVTLAQPTPVASAAQAPMGLTSDCNPNYAPCIPNSPTDLDCGDIRGMTVQVIGYDQYRFDRDGDGWGCE